MTVLNIYYRNEHFNSVTTEIKKTKINCVIDV